MMTQTVENPLQDQLKVVRERFITLLEERRNELEVLRDQIDQQDNNVEALQQTQFIAHKIAGTAGTLGFPIFGQLAAKTENTIIQHLSGKGLSPTFDDTKQVIDRFLMSAAKIS